MRTTDDDATVPGEAGTVVYRPARAEDFAAMAEIDGSFTTDSVFEVTAAAGVFTIRQTALDSPLHKTFPDESDDDDGGGDAEPTHTVVAVAGDELCGFLQASFAPWNARVTIRDIEVAPQWRGRGIGSSLMRHAFGFAREHGAVHVWLEVSNINAPAVRAYLRMGFVFCGLDTTLYDGTESAGERALFMSRRVD
ncbi:GNAT family N-acetyltransferase [Streptomyces sp. CG1]|uniref:GNAT family N-acetyltransferase n=1 Tax=Streptomyces sp. CG1 TaxID=1287523 RepID=UPI0034E2B9A2